MPEIYQTPRMEDAIRAMVERNHYVVVFRSYQSFRKIPLRQNEIKDIPAFICRPTDSFAKDTVANWQAEGGLMIYHRHRAIDILPDTESMLFVEAPYQHRDFEGLAHHVSREIVIYRPPTWALHEMGIETLYPMSNVHHTLYAVVAGFVGRELSPQHRVALELSGFPPDRAAVFEASEIEAVAGISGRQLRRILKGYGSVRHFVRYHRYTPQVEPEGQDERVIYDALEALPDCYRGERYLRFGKPPGGRLAAPAGWDKFLKILTRGGYISHHPPVYVFLMGAMKPDYIKVDALANARRGDWFKMRNIVDAAPEYPIPVPPAPSEP